MLVPLQVPGADGQPRVFTFNLSQHARAYIVSQDGVVTIGLIKKGETPEAFRKRFAALTNAEVLTPIIPTILRCNNPGSEATSDDQLVQKFRIDYSGKRDALSTMDSIIDAMNHTKLVKEK